MLTLAILALWRRRQQRLAARRRSPDGDRELRSWPRRRLRPENPA